MKQTLERIEKKIDLLMQFAEVVMDIMKQELSVREMNARLQFTEEINEEE